MSPRPKRGAKLRSMHCLVEKKSTVMCQWECLFDVPWEWHRRHQSSKLTKDRMPPLRGEEREQPGWQDQITHSGTMRITTGPMTSDCLSDGWHHLQQTLGPQPNSMVWWVPVMTVIEFSTTLAKKLLEQFYKNKQMRFFYNSKIVKTIFDSM